MRNADSRTRALLLVIVALAATGCRQVLGLDDLPLAPCADTTFGTGPVKACVAPPAEAVTIDGTLDTDASELCTGTLRDGTAACVVAGDSVTITSVRAIGSRPLVIIATTSLTVTTLLDVGSHADVAGAGADPEACGAGVDATFSTDGGGGFGGTFGGRGGDGGAGLEGLAGTAADAAAVGNTLRGGCPGGHGGAATADTVTAGRGGGAVYLIAGERIEIAGPLNASGSAGRGGSAGSGGGGGGSGGMIGLEAPAITIADTIAVIASGAGGGEGGSGGAGASGSEPDPTAPETAAAGGTGASTDGGDGGAGSIGAADGMPGSIATGSSPAAGGGGGGGAGVVIVRGTSTGGVVVPPPS